MTWTTDLLGIYVVERDEIEKRDDNYSAITQHRSFIFVKLFSRQMCLAGDANMSVDTMDKNADLPHSE